MDEAAGNVEQVLRVTASRTLAGDWALVLASAGIAHRLLERDDAFALAVTAGDAGAAGEALAAFDGANLATAAVRRGRHLSVGASTATFAALGILAGLQVVRRFRHGARGRRAWLPLAAGLGLFAMLGVGEHADVLAHLFGLGVGAVVG